MFRSTDVADEADGLPSDSRLRLGAAGRAAAIVVFVLAGWVALWSLDAPEEVSGAAAGFSLERAKSHVTAIAGAPRPTGSEAHRRAREYVMAVIRAAGLKPEIQEAVVPAGDPPRVHRLTRVQNVVARLPGTGSGDAVMLAAHYDSVPTAPGAGDDATGVAALLETMRVLAGEEPPARDIVFLFTDAEELGLHGARAFVDAGLADDVGWVLNFEARGAAGASLMFETMPGDTEAMRFSRAPRPGRRLLPTAMTFTSACPTTRISPYSARSCRPDSISPSSRTPPPITRQWIRRRGWKRGA